MDKNEEQGYELWEPEFGIDEFVITEFTCGACYQLAQQIHLLTGWPIFAEIIYEDEESKDFLHAWVVNNEGFAVDINGIHSNGWAKTKFSKEKPEGEIVGYLTNETFGCYSQWAKEIVHSFPEYFGITDNYIKNNIKSYLKDVNAINAKSKHKLHPELIGDLVKANNFLNDDELVV